MTMRSMPFSWLARRPSIAVTLIDGRDFRFFLYSNGSSACRAFDIIPKANIVFPTHKKFSIGCDIP